MAKLYVLGIDFSLTASKRLPVKLMCVQNGEMNVLALPVLPPFGPGLKAIFDEKLYSDYKDQVCDWFEQLVRYIGHKLHCIAIDCPTQYCKPSDSMRPSEKAVRALGCGIFKTPTQFDMEAKLTEARKQFEMTKKMKGGFSIWMKQAIDFVEWAQFYSTHLIEVFPGLYWKLNKLDKVDGNENILEKRMNHFDSFTHLSVLWDQQEQFVDDEIDALYCACSAAAFIENRSLVRLGDASDSIFCLINEQSAPVAIRGEL